MNVLADVARSARWLEAIGSAIPDVPAAARARVHAALGSAICAALLPSDENERAARTAAVRVLGALATGGGDDLRGCDPLALALIARLSPASDPGLRGVSERVERIADAATVSVRRRALIAHLLGTSAEDTAYALGAHETSGAALLTASEGVLHDACDAVEAFGLRDRTAAERERIGLALGARAFAALRTARGFELGTRLLRVVASERLDPSAPVEGLAYLRRLQRLDGSFGHLPPRSPQTGDIRVAFHLPRTVLSLWAIHDALAPVSLVRRAAGTLAGAALTMLAAPPPLAEAAR